MFGLQAVAIARIVGNAADANSEKVEAIRTHLIAVYNQGKADKAREVREVLNVPARTKD